MLPRYEFRLGLSDGSCGELEQEGGQCSAGVVAGRRLVVAGGDGAVLLEPGQIRSFGECNPTCTDLQTSEHQPS
jgi:hypothetical protein